MVQQMELSKVLAARKHRCDLKPEVSGQRAGPLAEDRAGVLSLHMRGKPVECREPLLCPATLMPELKNFTLAADQQRRLVAEQLAGVGVHPSASTRSG